GPVKLRHVPVKVKQVPPVKLIDVKSGTMSGYLSLVHHVNQSGPALVGVDDATQVAQREHQEFTGPVALFHSPPPAESPVGGLYDLVLLLRGQAVFTEHGEGRHRTPAPITRTMAAEGGQNSGEEQCKLPRGHDNVWLKPPAHSAQLVAGMP